MPSAGRPRTSAARARAHVAIVAASWNERVVDRLLAGAVDTLKHAGATHETFRVPGCFELPATARRLSRTRRFDAIIPLGCLIRGDTPHFHYLAEAVANGLMRLSLEEDVPIVFGVLTCDTEAQALHRAGGAEGNKGAEAAEGALELVALAQSASRSRTRAISRRTR